MTDGLRPEDVDRDHDRDRDLAVGGPADRDGGDADPVAAFAHQARAEYGDSIERLIAFGDAVRGDDLGVHASVELLVVLDDGMIDDAIETQLEALGESVGIEHGVVVSVYVLPAERFETQQDHPLIQQALEDGQAYV